METAARPGSDVRVVVLSSAGHRDFNWGFPDGLELGSVATPMTDYSTFSLYGMSKLANLYFAGQLAVRYPAITTASVHPGELAARALSGVASTCRCTC